MRRALCLLLLVAACGNDFDDTASWVHGLRLLAVRADPAEVAPGGTVSLRALAVAPGSPAPTVAWSACTLAPVAGSGTINPACVTGDGGALVPLGDGLTLDATLPDVAAATFGPADATGGLYLPLHLALASGSATLDGIDRLRLAGSQAPNHDPSLVAVATLDGTIATPLDENAPLPVAAGARVTLEAQLADGSVESYSVGDRPQTETLDVAWFATAGSFDHETAGPDVPVTWTADKHLPASGATIDLWLVVRDERGGSDFAHRALRLE